MRLEQLRYAEAALRYGSLRRAAHELRITQPSLSQQIQRLEEDLGVVLFVRTSAGIRPTPAAEVLAVHFRTLLRAESTMRQAASAIGSMRVGELRIGSVSTACRTLLPAAVRQFREEYPNIAFKVTEGGTQDIHSAVVRGELDLGLTSRFVTSPTPQDVSVIDLLPTELKACVPIDHPLAQLPLIHPDDLVHESLIDFRSGYVLHQVFERLNAGRHLQPVFLTESSDTARALVSAGVGIAILPSLAIPADEVAQGNYRAISLDVPWAWTTISALRRTDEQPAPAARALLRIIRGVATSLISQTT